MTETAPLPQKIVDTKTIVLRSRLDLNSVRLLGEKSKREFFLRYRFLKPSSQDIRMIYLDKYYEPYIIVGGKYALDYCKRHVYAVNVEDDMQEIFINGKKLKSEPSNSSPSSKVIKLEGETHSHFEVETYFILDRLGREIAPENLPFAPIDERPEKTEDIDVKLREVKISVDKEIEFLRSRIAVRPSDVAEVIREIFDINERTVIYSPMYQLTFQNIKTGKEAIAIINGITGEVVFGKFNKTISGRIIGDFIEACPVERVSPTTELDDSKHEPPPFVGNAQFSKEPARDLNKDSSDQQPYPRVLEAKEKLDFRAKVMGEVFHVGDNVTAIFGDLEIPSGTTVSETLAVKGTLKIGDNCRILEKVKASRDILIGANTTIDKDVISGGKVVIGPDSIINGSVESADHLEIGEHAVIKGDQHSKSSITLDQFDGAW